MRTWRVPHREQNPPQSRGVADRGRRVACGGGSVTPNLQENMVVDCSLPLECCVEVVFVRPGCDR